MNTDSVIDYLHVLRCTKSLVIGANTERGLESRFFIPFETPVNIERVREYNGFSINNALIRGILWSLQE